jgi:nicotinamidase-related amidase
MAGMFDDFPIVPEKTAVIFFDTLNGGLHSADAAAAQAIAASGYIELLQQVERACRAAGIAVFYTVPEHRQDGRDWGNQAVVGSPPRRNTFRGINYKGSAHAQVIPEIAPRPGDYVIAKHRWNAFFQTSLELSLRTAGIDTVILVGGATNVGIASTAYGARDHDFSLIIPRDGCRSGDPVVNDFFMDRVFPALARVVTVAELVEHLETRQPASPAPGGTRA